MNKWTEFWDKVDLWIRDNTVMAAFIGGSIVGLIVGFILG